METQAETAAPAGADTTVERVSERELVVTRRFRAPARLVFEAWRRPELFRRWWAPKSFGVYIVDCVMDVRTGGAYRLKMGHPSMPEPMTFFGRYREVVPPQRIVWTNEEAADGGQVTTVTFEEEGDETVVRMSELYPSKASLDEAMESGSCSGYPETFRQLETLLAGGDATAAA